MSGNDGNSNLKTLALNNTCAPHQRKYVMPRDYECFRVKFLLISILNMSVGH